jgi:hypothetical protein
MKDKAPKILKLSGMLAREYDEIDIQRRSEYLG